MLAPEAGNFFADAWRAIGIIAETAHANLPRDDLSLAINAQTGRSQDQLHIHMDCVRADVRDALHRLVGRVGHSWAPLPQDLGGHPYRAIRVDGDSLDAVNPFRLLADNLPATAAEMGLHTLVVVGMTFGEGAPGFILLDGRSDPPHGDLGNGEVSRTMTTPSRSSSGGLASAAKRLDRHLHLPRRQRRTGASVQARTASRASQSGSGKDSRAIAVSRISSTSWL